MKTIIITSLQQLESYRSNWTEILEENENDNPFIEYGWITTWWRYLSGDNQLFIIGVQHENEMIAFVPFMKKKGLLLERIYFIGYGQANYMDMIVSDKWKETVIRFVLEELLEERGNIIFHLHGLLTSKGTDNLLIQFLSEKGVPFHLSKVVSPFANTNEIEMEKYLKKRLKKDSLARKEKRLKKLGKVTFSTLTADQCDAMFKLHQKRWKNKMDTSGFSKGPTKEFFEELVSLKHEAFQTHIHALFFEGRLIAFDYGLQCRGRHVFYMPAHDDDFGAFSPGKIILKELIRSCVENNISIVDLSIGFEPYKYDWNTHIDYAYRITFSGSNYYAKAAYEFLKLKEIFVSYLKKYRSIVLFKRNTLGRWLNYFRKQDKKKAWSVFHKNVANIRKFLFERTTCYVYKQSIHQKQQESNVNPYKLISAIDLMNDDDSRKDLEKLIRRLYLQNDGFCQERKSFWVDYKVIRLHAGIEEQLPKNSAYVYDCDLYESTMAGAVLARNHQIEHIYITDFNKNKTLLQKGFKLKKAFVITTIAGRKFIKETRYEKGKEQKG
ncbi:hypothetical protein CD798_03220 [Bacillaceae bacterium SAOS 7]|nr:hypothetical protein CD798_03220 [Bacillaceae bacterium SAOS 7]